MYLHDFICSFRLAMPSLIMNTTPEYIGATPDITYCRSKYRQTTMNHKQQLHRSRSCIETTSVLIADLKLNQTLNTCHPATNKNDNNSNNDKPSVCCTETNKRLPINKTNKVERNQNESETHLPTCDSCTVFMVCSEQKGKPPKFVKICDNVFCGVNGNTEPSDYSDDQCIGFQDIDLSYVPSCL